MNTFDGLFYIYMRNIRLQTKFLFGIHIDQINFIFLYNLCYSNFCEFILLFWKIPAQNAPKNVQNPASEKNPPVM